LVFFIPYTLQNLIIVNLVYVFILHTFVIFGVGYFSLSTFKFFLSTLKKCIKISIKTRFFYKYDLKYSFSETFQIFTFKVLFYEIDFLWPSPEDFAACPFCWSLFNKRQSAKTSPLVAHWFSIRHESWSLRTVLSSQKGWGPFARLVDNFSCGRRLLWSRPATSSPALTPSPSPSHLALGAPLIEWSSEGSDVIMHAWSTLWLPPLTWSAGIWGIAAEIVALIFSYPPLRFGFPLPLSQLICFDSCVLSLKYYCSYVTLHSISLIDYPII